MKDVLPRFLSRRSIGLVIDVRRIAICVMQVSPLGRKVLTQEVHDLGQEPPVEVVRRLLQPWLPRRRGGKSIPGPWVRLGIPDAQGFLSVVPITQANRNASGPAYFLEAVQVTNVRAEDRTIDLVRLHLDRQPLACVAASPNSVVQGMADMVTNLGGRVGLIQHTPTALYRAGMSRFKSPGSKLCIRFFLNVKYAIGILAAGDQPLFWHSFELSEGQEGASVLAAYSTLWMLRRNARIGMPVDAVIMHGRPDLDLGMDADEFGKRTGARLFRRDGPAYEIRSAALGLALTEPISDEPRHDLARGLKPAPMIRDIFPWGEFVLHGALLLGASFLVGAAASSVDTRLAAVDAELASFPWARGMNQAKLDDERKALEDRAKVLTSFRGGRVPWSVPLRAIAAAAPEGTVIKSLSGDAEVETTSARGRSRSRKQLTVGFETAMSEDGTPPHEIDGFLATLRGDASIKQHFPLIEVSGLKANSVQKGTAPSASYSVVCLPLADAARKPDKR